MNANRGWKSFDERWRSSSRLGRFLGGSLMLHLTLGALLLLLPLAALQHDRAQAEAVREELQEKEKKEIEKLVEQTKEEFKDLLKEEIARAELKKLFTDLTRDFLDDKMTLDYWQELLESLDPELDVLGQMFEDPGQFEPAAVEKQLQQTREKLVEKLADLIEKKQLEPLRQATVEQAKQAAKDLAEQLKQGVEQTVAPAVAEQWKKLLDAEEKAQALARQKAEAELVQAATAAKAALQGLQQSKDSLEKLQQAAGDPGKKTEVKKGTATERTNLLAAGRQLGTVQAKMRAAGKQLAVAQPRTAAQVDPAPAEEAGAKVQEAAKQAVEQKPGEAAKSTAEAAKQAGAALEKIQQAQASLKLQNASKQLEELLQKVSGQKQEVAGQAKKIDQAEKAGDPHKLQLAKKAIAEGEKQATATAKATEELLRKLQELEDLSRQAGAAGKEAAQAAKKAGAASKTAVQAVQQAGAALKNQEPKSAGAALAKVQSELQKAGKEIETARQKLQGDGDVVQAARQQLQEQGKGELAKNVETRLEKLAEQKALPDLQKKIDTALDKELKKVPGATTSFKKKLQEEVGKVVAGELKGLQGGGEKFRQGLEAKLPGPELPAAKGGVDGTKLKDLTGKALPAGQATADKKLTELVDGTLKKLGNLSPGTGAKTAIPPQLAELMKRLDNVQNQLSQQRKDILPPTNQATVAALRQRHLERKASLSRGLGMGFDRKAYLAMVEQLKGRGQIVGETWQRQGATGEAATKTDELDLKPALVSTRVLPPETGTATKPAERKVQPPTFKTHRFEGIPFLADDAIKIDGDLSEWKNVPQLRLDPVLRGGNIKGTPILQKPANQIGYIAYCSKGVLLAVDIVDTSDKLENDRPVDAFWLNDCIEIYLDTLNTKYSQRGEPNTHQFFAFPFGHRADDQTGGYESHMYLENGGLKWKKIPYPRTEMPRAAKKTDHGWTMELLIPKEALRRGEVIPGRIIGFNLQIDTGTNLYYFWTCAEQIRTSEHPDTWGDIQFLGSDGKIELVGKDEKDVVKAIVPGQPIRVRVTDPDMNLTPQKKDRVSVTLRTQRGDLETLILEETGTQSGVFLGTLPTRLNLGLREPNVLEVFEGEIVTVEYLDQARAFGERNVPLQARFTVSSLGARVSR